MLNAARYLTAAVLGTTLVIALVLALTTGPARAGELPLLKFFF